MNPSFSIPRGDDYSLPGTYLISGQPYTISGLTITMGVKGDTAINTPLTIGPLTAFHSNDALGQFIFSFPSALTRVPLGEYYVDMLVVDQFGNRRHTQTTTMAITVPVTP